MVSPELTAWSAPPSSMHGATRPARRASTLRHARWTPRHTAAGSGRPAPGNVGFRARRTIPGRRLPAAALRLLRRLLPDLADMHRDAEQQRQRRGEEGAEK